MRILSHPGQAGALLAAILTAKAAVADTWHVSNTGGNDANDGRSSKTAFATIARAVKAAKTSDSIALANTGSPYREAIRLSGLGGTPAEPFVVEGNRAVVTGLKPLPAAGWKQEGEGVWLFAIEKKPYGNPFLVHNGRRLAAAKTAEAIEAGKGMGDYALEATLLDSGVALGGASYVVCRNVVSEYHSNDGFNIHGDCRGVVFENIVARHNGDAASLLAESRLCRDGTWDVLDDSPARKAKPPIGPTAPVRGYQEVRR